MQGAGHGVDPTAEEVPGRACRFHGQRDIDVGFGPCEQLRGDERPGRIFPSATGIQAAKARRQPGSDDRADGRCRAAEHERQVDHIVARQSSIVGSIGVLIQFPNFTGLMDKIGITLDEVKSSPLKAEPSPFNVTTDEEKAMLRSMIMDSYEWFVGLVDDRRPLTRAEVLALADGSIFTGRQALARKLVDELGGEEKAKDWLVTKGVDAKLDIVEWKPRKSTADFFLSSAMGQRVAAFLGFPGLDADLLKKIGADRIFLDGMLSLWHPDMATVSD